MKNGRVMDAERFKHGVERTDETGKCFRRIEGANDTIHYYRQEENRVLHVTHELVNTLPDNFLECSRINWADDFEEINPKVFNRELTETIQGFYS